MTAAGRSALRVLMAGPSAQSRGGIASVVRIMTQTSWREIDLIPVVTHRDGGVRVRATVAITGVARALWLLLRHRADVLHVHLSWGGSALRKGILLRLAALAGVPSVVHAHGSRFVTWFDALSPFGKRFFCFLLQADLYLVLGQEQVEQYRQRLQCRSVQVLPNPVVRPEVVPQRSTDGEVCAVFLGRFGERKGIYDLLDAFALMPPSLRLTVAGDGEVEQVRSRAAQLGIDVDIHSWLEPQERDDLLRKSDVLVLPSYHEGLPMAVLEAMAFGLVPVVTPVGGIPDVVVDSENGLLVQPGDTAALASALTRLVTDRELLLRLGAAARATTERFAAPAWAQRLEAIWSSVHR